jgi:hypothetical protein
MLLTADFAVFKTLFFITKLLIHAEMRKKILSSLMFLLFAGYLSAQCNGNEVEVRVEISTDNWGEETFWTLSDLLGTTVLQGGQGGVYGDFDTFSDSVCIAAGDCYFFEIYDTYGDGILDPYGYKLYVNEQLVSSGANDIGNYAIAAVNCQDSCGLVLNALQDFQQHLNGSITLNNSELGLLKNLFARFPKCLAQSESVILLAKNVIATYDAQNGALFTTPQTQNGISRDPAAQPGLALERAMLALQQGVFDGVFTPEVYAAYPHLIKGWKFNSCTNFPGYVDPPADSSLSRSVLIRANFEDPHGVNPYFDINFERMQHALRPTGLYLSPGSVAVISVPDSLVGRDYWVRVGSHDWDLTERPTAYRLDRISRRFPVNSNTIEVFNPMGGAISVLVPYGADEGIVTVGVRNGVQAPFFSLKSFDETTNFNAELSKPGPWAVFESDNVMYTIPKHSIVPGQYDLKKTLQDWETALRGMNSILARQIIPDKHNMYMIADVDIRTGVYSIGYPMSNTPLRYTDVPGPAYFINGPGPDDEVNFHESGHALAISKFPGEEEALVNFPYIMALNYGLNVDLNEAVKYSFVPNTFDIDKTATHRMVSNTFGVERDISNTEDDEVRYQHRGYGHYFEIVNVLGWCPLRNFWRQEFLDIENGFEYGIYQDIDGRILRMSVAAQADLRPLFHVFGVVPEDPGALQDTLEQIGIPPSRAIYDRLQAYLDLIPEDNSAFVSYALSVYPNLYTDGPTDNPKYGVGWHYLKSLSYNAAEAQDRTAKLQSIIALYYPDGAPSGQGSPDVCCLLDTIQISLVNEAVVVTGGVEPLNISEEINGNTKTVTVLDFDGCTSTAQFVLSSVAEKAVPALRVYPNPASTEVYMEIEASDKQIARVQIISLGGQVVGTYHNTKPVLDISALTAGMYMLHIELSDGLVLHQRLAVLR